MNDTINVTVTTTQTVTPIQGKKYMMVTVGAVDVLVKTCKQQSVNEDGEFFKLKANGVYTLKADNGVFFYVICKTAAGSSTLEIVASNDELFFLNDPSSLAQITPYIFKGTGGAVPDNTSLYDALTWKLQNPPAYINQENPVQNQYYTVLDSTVPTRIKQMGFRVDTTGETVLCRVTIDGFVVSAAPRVATAGSMYWCYFQPDLDGNAVYNSSTLPTPNWLEGKTLKVEICKTTNAGNGNIRCVVAYETR